MDVLKALKQMPDESVDMQICSPPYWGLRDYGEEVEVIWGGDCCERCHKPEKECKCSGSFYECEHEWGEEFERAGYRSSDTNPGQIQSIATQNRDKTFSNFCSKCGAWKGQLGLEPDFNLYIKHLANVFDEVKRVLKKDGTCFINLGDTYSSTPMASISDKADISQGTLKSQLNRLDTSKCGIQPKCLCAIPERFIVEMINRGWILRNKIIWHKPNHMPTSVKDRFATSWEYLLFFSKSKKYFFDLDAVREAHKHGEGSKFNLRVRDVKRGYAEKSGQYKASDKEVEQYHGQQVVYNPKGKNPDDVIQTKFSEGDGYRQGMNRDEDIVIEYRPNLLTQEELTEFLLEWTNGFEEDLDKEFGEHKWRHWIRKDASGFSYPSRKDWITLKTMLDFPDTYDEQMLLTEKKSNAIINNPSGKNPDDIIKIPHHPKGDENRGMRLPPQANQPNAFHPLGKNPSDFWDITTHGYPEAHFAVFPKALVKRPIKTTRKNAVIMDVFAGSGTTLAVARKLGRDSIGIEIKKEYCDLIFKRLYKGNIPLDKNEFKLIK